MRRRSVAGVAAAVLLASGAAAAAVPTTADGVVQVICSDADDTPHPKRMTLDLPVGDEVSPELDRVRLVFVYEAEAEAEADESFRGRVKATAVRFDADGVSRKLGSVKGFQNAANGDVTVEQTVDGPLAAGDLVRFMLRFRRFDAVPAGTCLNLVVAVAPPPECGPYPAAADSPYRLPYRSGQALVLSQGNCSAIGSHRGDARHAYDFAMPRGTEIVAARAGVVVAVDDSRPDDTGLFDDDNAVVIQHDDGTLASYVHIQQGGARVVRDQAVAQGELIALSGNSGSTSGLPHLHFQVTTCSNRRDCGTEPIAFSNAKPNPGGLEVGQRYRAGQ